MKERIKLFFGCVLIVFLCNFLLLHYKTTIDRRRTAVEKLEEGEIKFKNFNQSLEEYEKRNHNDLLIINVYSLESKIDPRPNLEFFIKHGLHDAADFLFVDNGGEVDVELPNKTNVFNWKRENTCFDIGTHYKAIEWMASNHYREYKRYILMNMSVRGPFMPSYSTDCWSDFFAGEDTFIDDMAMTGTTFHCKRWILPAHIQAMVVGVSQEGIEIWKERGLMECAEDMNDAIGQEINLTKALTDHGKKIKVTMGAAWTRPNYFETCRHTDLNYPGYYYQGTIQTTDVMFIKTGRDLDNATIDRYSEFSSEYSSYPFCKRSKGRMKI